MFWIIGLLAGGLLLKALSSSAQKQNRSQSKRDKTSNNADVPLPRPAPLSAIVLDKTADWHIEELARQRELAELSHQLKLADFQVKALKKQLRIETLQTDIMERQKRKQMVPFELQRDQKMSQYEIELADIKCKMELLQLKRKESKLARIELNSELNFRHKDLVNKKHELTNERYDQDTYLQFKKTQIQYLHKTAPPRVLPEPPPLPPPAPIPVTVRVEIPRRKFKKGKKASPPRSFYEDLKEEVRPLIRYAGKKAAKIATLRRAADKWKKAFPDEEDIIDGIFGNVSQQVLSEDMEINTDQVSKDQGGVEQGGVRW